MTRALQVNTAILVDPPTLAASLCRAIFCTTSDVPAKAKRRLEALAADALFVTLADRGRAEHPACLPGQFA